MMNKKGFSLVEVLVVMVMTSLLVGVLFTILLQGHAMFRTSGITASISNNARQAITLVSSELKRTSASQISITQNMPAAGTDKIVYHLPALDGSNEPLVTAGTLQWNPNDIEIMIDPGNPGRLIRIDATGTYTLANNVKTIRFIDRSIQSSLYMDELKIILEMEKISADKRVHTMTTTSVLNMRN